MAISEKKGQGLRKASHILTSTLKPFCPAKKADLNYYARGRQLSHCKTKLNQIRQKRACIFNQIIHITQKAGFSRLLQHSDWKRSGTILVEWEGMKKQENRRSESEREK